MDYKLYTDKSELFEAKLTVDGAKEVRCRLLIENDNINIVFNGKIENNKCTVKIPKLNGILDEGTTGNIRLEVIADNTLFEPWSKTYSVSQKTKVTVNEQTIVEDEESVTDKKVVVEVIQNEEQSQETNIKELIKELHKQHRKRLDEQSIKDYSLDDLEVKTVNNALRLLHKKRNK